MHRSPTEIRLALRANGYDPTATLGKRPLQPDWQTKIGASPEEIESWGGPDSGCISTRTPGFDVDLKDPEAAEAIRQKIYDRFDGRGQILERTGEAPKFLVPFRTEKPFAVINQWLMAPNGKLHLLQFLCDGQQYIVSGTHEDIKKPYTWRNGRDLTNTPRSELPEINGDEAHAFFRECCDLLVRDLSYTLTNKFGRPIGNGQNKTASSTDDVDPDGIEAMLASVLGGEFNAVYCHVAPKLFCRGWHPNEVVNYLHSHFMQRAQILNLPWKNKAEKQRKVLIGRVKSTLKYLAKDYDHHSGEIPPWVAPEFQADWVRVIARGNQPEIHFDGKDWQVYEIKTAADAGTAESQTAKPADKKLIIPLTADEWLTRDLSPPDRLLGDWLTTTSRVLLSADTGLGKTMLCMDSATYIAGGVDFLHWCAHRPARVLYIDGEMSQVLYKQRIAGCVRRLGFAPAGIYFLSKEDIPNFAPLNSPAGAAFLLSFIEQLGGIDLVKFDNVMALTIGDQKDEDAWSKVLPLVSELTRRHIGQVWINHTGHDTSRSYGSKTKEWRMDTTIHLTAVERADTDVSFQLEFRKARERTPENRAGFRDATIALVDDQWVGSEAISRGRPSDQEASVLKILDALTKGPAMVMHRGFKAVPSAQWEAECLRRGLVKSKNAFRTIRSRLAQKNLIQCDGEVSWRT
jgi:hypothetical protein